MAQATGVPPKTEQQRRHTSVASSRSWVRRAEGLPARRAYRPEGYRGSHHVIRSWQVPVNHRRPPSLPLNCRVFPAHSSFSVFGGTPMAFFCVYFKELTCYFSGSSARAHSNWNRTGTLTHMSTFSPPRVPGSKSQVFTPVNAA
jgi:hypothetical protein